MVQKQTRQGERTATPKSVCWESCGLRNKKIKGHIKVYHFPACFQDISRDSRHEERALALNYLATLLLGEQAGVRDLWRYLEDTGKLPARFRLSPDDPFIPEMRDFCRCRQLEIPDSFSFHPINSEACLTHWRPLVQLLMGLNKSQLALFKKFKLYEERDLVDEIVQHNELLDSNVVRVAIDIPRPEPQIILEPVREIETIEAVDSHCHLDRMSPSAVWDVEGYLAKCSGSSTVPVKVSGGVAVFCDPESYPPANVVLPASWTMAVGIHPKKAAGFTDGQFQRLRSLLKRPGTALGEIGLDRTDRFANWKSQRCVLERVLPLVNTNRPLVLHNRGSDPWGDDVGARCRSIISNYIMREQPIHLHCFTGTPGEVVEWMKGYPKAYFGYTALVNRFDCEQQCALISVPDDRLLLETDSPHLAPGCHRRNSPFSLEK